MLAVFILVAFWNLDSLNNALKTTVTILSGKFDCTTIC